MNIEEIIKDYRKRFILGGWPNPDINFVVIEKWLRSLVVKEEPAKIEPKEAKLKTKIKSKNA